MVERNRCHIFKFYNSVGHDMLNFLNSVNLFYKIPFNCVLNQLN
jgi:hypothetical protein